MDQTPNKCLRSRFRLAAASFSTWCVPAHQFLGLRGLGDQWMQLIGRLSPTPKLRMPCSLGLIGVRRSLQAISRATSHAVLVVWLSYTHCAPHTQLAAHPSISPVICPGFGASRHRSHDHMPPSHRRQRSRYCSSEHNRTRPLLDSPSYSPSSAIYPTRRRKGWHKPRPRGYMARPILCFPPLTQASLQGRLVLFCRTTTTPRAQPADHEAARRGRVHATTK